MSNNCIFCKIVSGEIPTDFVYQSDSVVAFKDINPEAPVHVLIVPKKHTTRYDVFLGRAAHAVAQHTGVATTGYRLIINQGKDAHQEVEHLHMHFLGGKDLGAMIQS
ncbi:HIT domain-containing protein [Candidatus Berkelbacteria bacterium]|nr:HIT domain-containing protein [Candidatus Berkelbacteria bacterium]